MRPTSALIQLCSDFCMIEAKLENLIAITLPTAIHGMSNYAATTSR
jgi:hypothetical protein